MSLTPRAARMKLKEKNYRESLLVWRADKRASIPRRDHPDCFGYDLCVLDACVLIPGMMTIVTTGIVIRVPDAHYGRVTGHERALMIGLDVVNSVINPNNRSVIMVALVNRTATIINLPGGSIVAMLILERASQVDVFEAVSDLSQLNSQDTPPGSVNSVNENITEHDFLLQA